MRKLFILAVLALMVTAGGAFAVERFVLDRRNWASLKAWGADDHRGVTDAA